MKMLLCHTDMRLDNGYISAFKGKEYEVTYEDNRVFNIINEKGNTHSFTKEPEEDGRSFSTWFELVERDYKKRSYIVWFENEDSVIVNVKDDVNRPNNDDCDTVLQRWINDNYGDEPYGYAELEDVPIVEL